MSKSSVAENEATYIDLAERSGVPEHLREGLALYLVARLQPGHFLTAVLENDLSGAVARGDDESLRGLASIVRFLYNHAPNAAWGSREKVAAWRAGQS